MAFVPETPPCGTEDELERLRKENDELRQALVSICQTQDKINITLANQLTFIGNETTKLGSAMALGFSKMNADFQRSESSPPGEPMRDAWFRHQRMARSPLSATKSPLSMKNLEDPNDPIE